MSNWIILAVLAVSVCLWLYCCYKDFTSDRREKKAKRLKKIRFPKMADNAVTDAKIEGNAVCDCTPSNYVRS